MTIIADQPNTEQNQRRAERAIADIQARAEGLSDIAHFLRSNPDLPGYATVNIFGVLVPLSTHPDPRAAVSAWMLRAIDAGALAEAFSDGSSAGVRLYFGPMYLQAYANAKQMIELERIEVVTEQWRLGIEIPEHGRRNADQSSGGA
ncbi:hypothetical protein [Nonomuraea sp. 10N515B]|uniref:hypothetical protein n=1 Tax=Nonomuraea sp. 10N515B TaxID=3457422 RepID=UPI003FCD386E